MPCGLTFSCELNLPCKQAEKSLIGKGNKEYLPIQGLASFNKATAELLLGPDSPAIKEVDPALSDVPLMSNPGLSNPVPCKDNLSTSEESVYSQRCFHSLLPLDADDACMLFPNTRAGVLILFLKENRKIYR